MTTTTGRTCFQLGQQLDPVRRFSRLVESKLFNYNITGPVWPKKTSPIS